MTSHAVATDRREWLDARIRLLAREKQMTRLHDEISTERRALPWVPVTQDYRFAGSSGEVWLSLMLLVEDHVRGYIADGLKKGDTWRVDEVTGVIRNYLKR